MVLSFTLSDIVNVCEKYFAQIKIMSMFVVKVMNLIHASAFQSYMYIPLETTAVYFLADLVLKQGIS